MATKVTLEAFDEVEGVSLMSGTGVSDKDILVAVGRFTMYANEKKDSNLIDFFSNSRVNKKVLKAFALIGMKHVCDELYHKMKDQEAEVGDKKDTEGNT